MEGVAKDGTEKVQRRHPATLPGAAKSVCARWEKDIGGRLGVCQWLDGDVRLRRYCGKKTVTSTAPYCCGHTLRASGGVPETRDVGGVA